MNITAQQKQTLRNMYNLYNNNPQQFIEDYKKNNPQQALILNMLNNPNELFENMLKQTGMTQDEFKNIFI